MPIPDSSGGHNLVDVGETLDILVQISRILGTGLDRETLGICVQLIEAGVDPGTLAMLVQELRKTAAAEKAKAQSSASTCALPATVSAAPFSTPTTSTSNTNGSTTS